MNIRKKPLHRLKSEIGCHGDLLGKMMDEFKEPDTWTIITAPNHRHLALRESRV